MDARGKFGEHEGSVRVARGVAVVCLQVAHVILWRQGRAYVEKCTMVTPIGI